MWVEAAAAVPYHYYFAFWMAKTATSCTKTNAYSRDAHSVAHNVKNVAKITILQYFSSKSFRFNNPDDDLFAYTPSVYHKIYQLRIIDILEFLKMTHTNSWPFALENSTYQLYGIITTDRQRFP